MPVARAYLKAAVPFARTGAVTVEFWLLGSPVTVRVAVHVGLQDCVEKGTEVSELTPTVTVKNWKA